MNDKQSVRKKFLALRQQIEPTYRQKAALAATQQLLWHPLFQQAQHIACYYPVRDEFDSIPIIHTLWQHKKNCYLPLITAKKNGLMHFLAYQKGDFLKQNSYGIFEPLQKAQEIPVQNLEMVIVPLLAFDFHGHRLGTGGGYYDKNFAFLRHNAATENYLVGLAYATQQTNALPVDPWDIPLNSIITEQNIYYPLIS